MFEVEEAKKEMKNRKDFWLHTNIVVKIITKKLGEKYYKKKAVVKVLLKNSRISSSNNMWYSACSDE